MKNTVVRYFDEIVEKYPEKIAIETESNSVTFTQYKEQALQIATYIVKKIQVENSAVAVYLPKDERQLITFLGVLYSGNHYSPIPFQSPEERGGSIVEALHEPVVVTLEEYVEDVKRYGVEEKNIVFYDEMLQELADRECIDKVLDQVIDTDPAYILFTSGSTGKPKGVVISHRGIIDYIEWSVEKFDLNEETVLASQAPFYFDASMPDIYTPYFTGAKLVIVPERMFLFSKELVEFNNKKKVNTLIWVPSALINLTRRKAIEQYKFEYLEKVMFCGEVMPTKNLRQWREVYPDVKFVNLYGPTEAVYACTYYIVDKDYKDDEILPLGHACENTRIFLLSEKNERVKEAEEVGEICIQGSCLAKGYLNAMDHEAFVNDPTNHQYCDRIYKTGDLGKYDKDGLLRFVGRKDSQIKHMGYRIELGEIESVVSAHEDIMAACVVYSKVKKKICLYFEVNKGKTLETKEMREYLKQFLPKYMMPEVMERLENMPYNMNGKMDRKYLEQKANQ